MNITVTRGRMRGITDKLPNPYVPILPQQTRAPKTVASRVVVLAQISGFFIVAVTTAYLLLRFGSLLNSLGAWGYLGVAAVEFANSAMVLFPTPAPAYTFAMGATLNPLVVGLVGGAAAALGELIGYWLGRKGSAIVPDRPIVLRMRAWTEQYGGIALFVFAALPVPFDFAGVWAGAARYPLARFLPVVLMGKTVKITTIALAGYFGLEALKALVA